jgi:hypothetical protein
MKIHIKSVISVAFNLAIKNIPVGWKLRLCMKEKFNVGKAKEDIKIMIYTATTYNK